jgi:hypothetical protein
MEREMISPISGAFFSSSSPLLPGLKRAKVRSQCILPLSRLRTNANGVQKRKKGTSFNLQYCLAGFEWIYPPVTQLFQIVRGKDVQIGRIMDDAFAVKLFYQASPPSMFMALRLIKCSMRPLICGGHSQRLGQ